MNLLKKKIFEESPVLENRYKTEAKSVDLINLLEISKWKRTYEDLKNIGLHISVNNDIINAK